MSERQKDKERRPVLLLLTFMKPFAVCVVSSPFFYYSHLH